MAVEAEQVLNTKAVCESQTCLVEADKINGILEEFQINTEVVAATVDNASNVDVAQKNLKILKESHVCSYTKLNAVGL